MLQRCKLFLGPLSSPPITSASSGLEPKIFKRSQPINSNLHSYRTRSSSSTPIKPDPSIPSSKTSDRKVPSTSSPKASITTYRTLESVEELLSSKKYHGLIQSGWVVHQIEDHDSIDHPSILVLHKDYGDRFKSWDQALGWLRDRVSPIANKLNHHPDLSITNFNQLQLTVWTHSLKALTQRDFKLALELDRVEPKANTKP